MSDKVKEKVLDLLWDFLKVDPDHPDRRVLGLGHGGKTRQGLIATLERIIERGDYEYD